MRTTHIILSLFVAFNLIANIFTIAILMPRTNYDDLGFDYIGFVVGVLAILITVVTTWNIYNALDISKRVVCLNKYIEQIKKQFEKGLDDSNNKLKNTIDENQKRTIRDKNVLGAIFTSQKAEIESIIINGEISLDFIFLYDSIKAIKLLLKYEEYKEADGCIFVLTTTKSHKFQLTDEQITYIIKLYQGIDKDKLSQLEKYAELEHFMNYIKQNQNPI